jgi:hypothetical protein
MGFAIAPDSAWLFPGPLTDLWFGHGNRSMVLSFASARCCRFRAARQVEPNCASPILEAEIALEPFFGARPVPAGAAVELEAARLAG